MIIRTLTLNPNLEFLGSVSIPFEKILAFYEFAHRFGISVLFPDIDGMNSKLKLMSMKKGGGEYFSFLFSVSDLNPEPNPSPISNPDPISNPRPNPHPNPNPYPNSNPNPNPNPNSLTLTLT